MENVSKKVLNITRKSTPAFCANNFCHAGFTLAEVLITLGIIGVVAAITLPTLVQNYKKHVYVNQLKKSVSTLEQGFKKMLADEGVERLDQIPNLNDWSWTNGPNNPYFEKYFKVVPVKYDSIYPDGYYYLGGEHVSILWNLDNYFYFNDGSLIGIQYWGGSYWAALLVIDVNGDKKLPNKVGRDIFYFSVRPNGSLEARYGKSEGDYNDDYWRNNTKYCGTPDNSTIPANTYGSGCAARIIENGWKMDY